MASSRASTSANTLLRTNHWTRTTAASRSSVKATTAATRSYANGPLDRKPPPFQEYDQDSLFTDDTVFTDRDPRRASYSSPSSRRDGAARSRSRADDSQLSTPQPPPPPGHMEWTSSPHTVKRDFAEAKAYRQRHRANLDFLSTLGSTQNRLNPAWRPSDVRRDPPSARDVTISHLLAATAHVGHAVGRVSPAFQPFVYGHRHGVAQIDLEKATLPMLRKACKVVRDIAAADGVIVILGTQEGVGEAVIAASRRMAPHGYHITKGHWTPGLITNSARVLDSAARYKFDSYKKHFEGGDLNAAENVSRAKFNQADKGGDSEEGGLNPQYIAQEHLQPDLLIVLNPRNNSLAIKEATLNRIPTMAIIDSDIDPRVVTYPIPANSDSRRSVEMIIGILSKAGQEGARERRALVAAKARADAENEEKMDQSSSSVVENDGSNSSSTAEASLGEDVVDEDFSEELDSFFDIPKNDSAATSKARRQSQAEENLSTVPLAENTPAETLAEGIRPAASAPASASARKKSDVPPSSTSTSTSTSPSSPVSLSPTALKSKHSSTLSEESREEEKEMEHLDRGEAHSDRVRNYDVESGKKKRRGGQGL